MARVVVVGGGFAGMSTAARLAKLGHAVTVMESTDTLGGRLNGHCIANGTWQLSLDTVTLPGVLRDLFRTSGRPLEKVLELTPTVGRRHVFADKTSLDLPFGDRANQHDALRELFGEEEPWSGWVDAMADSWDVLRRNWLETLSPPGRAARRALKGHRRLKRPVRKALGDERLEALALDGVVIEGDYPDFTPAFVTLQHYVERTFGRWQIQGGMPALADALVTRLHERGVVVRTGMHAHEISVDAGRVTGITTDSGHHPADLVVWTAGRTPRPVPIAVGLPIIPAMRTLLRLAPTAPQLPRDVLTHGNPPIHLWNDGSDRWTIAHLNAEDPLIALVRVGIDLRGHVLERHDLGPVELVGLGAWGWQWQGWRTTHTRPTRGFNNSLYYAGANAHPGATIEHIGSATAAIATEIGKA